MAENKRVKGKITKTYQFEKTFGLLLNGVLYTDFGQLPSLKEGDSVELEYVSKQFGGKTYYNITKLKSAKLEKQEALEMAKTDEEFNVVPIGVLAQEKAKLKKKFDGDDRVYGQVLHGLFLNALESAMKDAHPDTKNKPYNEVVKDYFINNVKMYNELV